MKDSRDKFKPILGYYAVRLRCNKYYINHFNYKH